MNKIQKLNEQNILITGASGFVGKNLYNYLIKLGINEHNIFKPTRQELDLMDIKQLRKYLFVNKINTIINCAGLVGGVFANKNRQADGYYQNIIMGTNVIEAARYILSVRKVVAISAGCGYPNNLTPPFKETDIFNGFPEMSSYGYSMAKKMLIVQAMAYKEQYKLNTTVLLPANLYGPHDNFNLKHSHVVPALIRKFYEAEKTNSVNLWGNGEPTREFLYVDDLCKSIVDSVFINEVGPFNVGTGVETSIKELANVIRKISKHSAPILWDSSMPNGQNRRFYDMTKFKQTFGYIPEITLEEGIQKTYKWFEQNYENIRK